MHISCSWSQPCYSGRVRLPLPGLLGQHPPCLTKPRRGRSTVGRFKLQQPWPGASSCTGSPAATVNGGERPGKRLPVQRRKSCSCRLRNSPDAQIRGEHRLGLKLLSYQFYEIIAEEGKHSKNLPSEISLNIYWNFSWRLTFSCPEPNEISEQLITFVFSGLPQNLFLWGSFCQPALFFPTAALNSYVEWIAFPIDLISHLWNVVMMTVMVFINLWKLAFSKGSSWTVPSTTTPR